MEFLLRKTSFLAITLLIIANFLFGNFVLSKGIEISGKDIERIKAGLDVVQLFTNIAIGDEKVKTALNTGVKGGKAGTDVTYGLLVLTAMNEMDLIDMVVSQRYKQEATAYFDQIIDERISLTSYWKGVGYDLPRVVKGNVNSPMVGLTLNSFSITDKVVSIFIAFNVIRQEKIYDGLWYYFSLRRENKESHQIAWEDAKILMGWAVNARIEETGAFIKGKKSGEENISQLESQFSTLWDKWGPYTDRFGVTEAAKKKFNEEIGQLVVEAVGQQALAEEEKEPSLFGKIFDYLSDRAYEIFTGAWNTIKSAVSQVNPFGETEVGQNTFEVVPRTEEERAEIIQRLDLKTAEEVGQEQDFGESFEEGIEGPESPTPAELAELQRQINEAARMVEALTSQVFALINKQEKQSGEVEKEEELVELEKQKDAAKAAICPVNVNTASVQELQAITGVGSVISQRIVAARQFASLSDLIKVKGIGPVTLQKIIDQGCAFAAGFIASGGGGGSAQAAESIEEGGGEEQESQEEEEETEPAQNLLANEFFEEWINPPKHWNMGDHTNDAQKSSQALRGESSLNIKHTYVGLRNIEQHLASTTADLGNPEKAYGEVRVKGTGYIRIGVKAGQENYDHSDWVKLEDDDWTAIKHEHSAIDSENVWEFRIQTSRRQNAHASSTNPHEFLQTDLQIGAAWLSTAQPPETWPMGQPPNKVEQFTLDTQNSYSNRASLTWATSTDPDTASENLSYKIYYSKEGELAEDNLENASTTITTQATTIVFSLDFNSTYHFGIKAFDPENNFSDLATTTPYKTATLATITGNFSFTSTFDNNGRKLVRTSNGDLYTVYHRNGKIFLSKSADNSIIWTESAVTPDDENQINPSIAVDSQNNLHIAWQGKVGTSTSYQIRYVKYDGASFGEIDNFTEDEEQDQTIPMVAVDTQDNIHLAWVGRTDLGNRLYYIRNSGGGWASAEIVKERETVFGASNIFQFSFSPDRENLIHFVWFEKPPTGSISLRHRKIDSQQNAEDWPAFEQITTVFLGDYFSLVVDSQNNLHLVWRHRPSPSVGDPIVNYAKYIDSWSEIETLNEESSNLVIPCCSVAVDVSDVLYVVWKISHPSQPRPVSQVEYKNGEWQDVKELIAPFSSQGLPNLLSQPDLPKTGYAFVFYEGEELKFYGSEDLTFE